MGGWAARPRTPELEPMCNVDPRADMMSSHADDAHMPRGVLASAETGRVRSGPTLYRSHTRRASLGPFVCA